MGWCDECCLKGRWGSDALLLFCALHQNVIPSHKRGCGRPLFPLQLHVWHASCLSVNMAVWKMNAPGFICSLEVEAHIITHQWRTMSNPAPCTYMGTPFFWELSCLAFTPDGYMCMFMDIYCNWSWSVHTISSCCCFVHMYYLRTQKYARLYCMHSNFLKWMSFLQIKHSS